MFNPFHVFEPRFLPAFKQKGVKAFVQQTYERGRNVLDPEAGAAYLLIHFHEANKAKEHYDAIAGDAGRRLYHVEDAADWKELHALLNQASNKRFYTLLTVKDVNEKARQHLDKKIHAYIDYKTNWRPHSYEQVSFSLQIVTGRILVRLQYGARFEEIELDELEKMGYVL